ncbi:MAG TPA: ABC transporter permease subunit [Candidatus Dormibacteraeota bacterium]|jgi:ABC-type transport system involved in multi-copper enzyme maturation permease subunit|nr:ABC transporter permease subunit [Candidatus Dormibacteraeota bacterium]
MSTAAIAFQPRSRTRLGGAVRSELLKLRRQRLTWVLAALVAVSAVVMAILFLGSSNTHAQFLHDPLGLYFTYLTACQTVFDCCGGIFLLALSARLVGMEYSSGAIRIVLGRGTSRLGLLAAQLVALVVAGLLLLVAFSLVCAAILAGAVLAWHGSLSTLTSLPRAAWTDTGVCGAVALVSIGVCTLIGAAASAVGRSVSIGLGVALALFPADNLGTIVMNLIGHVTHQSVWAQAPHWFLGPTLNQLAATLQTDHPAPVLLITALGTASASHLWTVIGIWAAGMALATFLLTWRRDVLE